MREILGMARAKRPAGVEPQHGLKKAAPVPCGTCPYRRDVPSGIWMQNEYDKLPLYDGRTWEQSPALFLCHQHDGCICSGWLACHDPQELLALRFYSRGGLTGVDPSVFHYTTHVPVFSTGAEARTHGMREIGNPGPRAQKMIDGLVKMREDRDE